MDREVQVEAALGADAGIASRLALQAGALVRTIHAGGFEVGRKTDRSVVTRADVESDALIRQGLKMSFPSDGLLSEETTGILRGSSNRTWVVDPLDGTSGYVNGTDGYAVQIGLLEGDVPTMGLVYEPARDLLWAARTGHGTWCFAADGEVSRRVLGGSDRSGDDLRVVSSSRMPDSRRAAVAAALGARDLGPVSSVGVKVALLVGGDAEFYVSDHPVSYWDSCAPLVILREAGGRASMAGAIPFSYSLDGDDWSHPGPFMASSSRGHVDALELVSKTLGW